MVQETIEYLPLAAIETDGNIRKQVLEEEDRGLLQSLLGCGQLSPIRVRRFGKQFKTTDGARRVLAARKAGWESIAAIVEADDGEAGAKQRALICNCQRADLSASETAEGVAELMQATDSSASETAAKLGFSNAKVSRLLALLTLPESIRQQIREGKISASAGYELARVEDGNEQAARADQVAGGLTRDALAGAVKRSRSPRTETASPGAQRITVPLGKGRSVSLAGAGLNSLDTLIAWLEELLGKARKGRPKGLELGTFVRILRDEAKVR